jgi:maltose O-acetyltransferase
MLIGGGSVRLGGDCLIGPRCGFFWRYHGVVIARRLDGWELPRPVSIGNNVWIGGSVTITPGVTIGDNSIIGAGSVVTRDVPAGVVAVGNPCRVLRPIAVG